MDSNKYIFIKIDIFISGLDRSIDKILYIFHLMYTLSFTFINHFILTYIYL